MIGDGDKYKRRSCDSETHRITTTSRELAIQVQEILARGGIFASIRNTFKTGCKIDNRILKDSVQYLISFKLDRKHKFVHNNGDHFLIPIRRIEKKEFDGAVYNLGVAFEPNSYLVRGFAVHNCGAAIATSSMITELAKGKTLEEGMKITRGDIAGSLGGLPPIKMHCSNLAADGLHAAILDYFKRQNRPVPEWMQKLAPKEEEHEHGEAHE
ncbi:MAG: hypothetical protein CVT47_01035 [Thermoplasmata archaeon HGW-Thermoplasmata-2]|nr:MAG: hypothetical protein CVT47_01035 [Thermoplasmata archaeon HGW-Thermoplasmata-2]